MIGTCSDYIWHLLGIRFAHAMGTQTDPHECSLKDPGELVRHGSPGPKTTGNIKYKPSRTQREH